MANRRSTSPAPRRATVSSRTRASSRSAPSTNRASSFSDVCSSATTCAFSRRAGLVGIPKASGWQWSTPRRRRGMPSLPRALGCNCVSGTCDLTALPIVNGRTDRCSSRCCQESGFASSGSIHIRRSAPSPQRRRRTNAEPSGLELQFLPSAGRGATRRGVDRPPS